MIPLVNFWAILLATASSMLVGSIWYSPRVFGAHWMRLARIDPTKMGSPTRAIIVTVVVSFITAWVLAAAVYVSWDFFGGSFLAVAVTTGIALWGGLTAARFITHDAFEGRPVRLTLLNASHEAVTVVVMALLIGIWPPAGA